MFDTLSLRAPGLLLALVASLTACGSTAAQGHSVAATATPIASMSPSPAFSLPSPTACAVPAIKPPPNPTPVASPDAPSSQVQATIPIQDSTAPDGTGPSDVEIGFGSAWVANHRSRTISRIDPQTNTEVATITPAIPEGFNLGPVAVGPHGVWYAFAGDPDSKQLLFHINPATNGVDQVLPVKGITTILDSDAGLWGLVQGSTRNSLVQLSGDGKTLKTVDLGPPPTTGSSSPFYAFGSLWVAVDDKKLARIDPVGGVITAVVSTPATILGWRTMTADSTHAFLTLYDLSVVRIDPTNNCVDAQLFFGSNIGLNNPLNGRISVLSTPKGLYVGFARGALALVDPATMTVLKSVRLDEQDLVGRPGFGFGSIWYPTFSENSVLRVKPLG